MLDSGSTRTLILAAVLAMPCASPGAAQTTYTGVDGQISFMMFHTLNPVSANWTCNSADSLALDTDGSGVVENDECYASLPSNWSNFGTPCSIRGVKSSLFLQELSGDKPGRKGNDIYHLVQANNQTQSYGGVPNIGPGRATDTTWLEGDNFILFKCPLTDPNCKNTSPVLVNASLRPDNATCPTGNPLFDPECDRYNWQLKSTNEFPPTYNQLEVWAKLQNTGLKYFHDPTARQTGQAAGVQEFLFKDAVVVMNRTTTAVPFSSALQRQWNGPFNPVPAAKGWENAFIWYMDNRWCDGTYGFSIPSGGCPANAPLEARLIDVQIERRIFNTSLPDLSGKPDSGSCTLGVDCNALTTKADGVGFLNFKVDSDRDVLAQHGGMCLDTVNGGVTTNCSTFTIPASCASRTNTSAACLPVTGCNCCEGPSTCKNPYVDTKSAYVIVDARKALFFPEYNSSGTAIVGWTWVKWGKVLSERPPFHPGVTQRITEVNVATTPSGGQEWQLWQRLGAGALAVNPLPIAACDQSSTLTTVPSAPYTAHSQINSLPFSQSDAWNCNVGTTAWSDLKAKGRVLKYTTFDPNTGVITSSPRLPSYTNPHMPTWYDQGISWLAGFLEVKDSSGAVDYRSISWGGWPQVVCNVTDTTANTTSRAVLYEELDW